MAFSQKNGVKDSLEAKYQAQLLVYLDLYHKRAPSIQELKCFIDGLPKEPFFVSFLQQKNFDGYYFMAVNLDTIVHEKTHADSMGNHCTYRITYGGNVKYTVCFDYVHKKIYRLIGFYSSDFKELYNDYLYFNSLKPDFIKNNKGKNNFIKNHSIEKVDMSALWDSSMSK